MDREQTESALAPYRALDLTDEKGFLCGRILGDLGADVIKIEPPGGDPARNIGPFYHDEPHPEKSLYWLAYNCNKRGVSLNIETNDGKEIFKKLVKNADFVIESFPPGHMSRLGLGYATLKEINPGIIMVSITHFGQTGPYKDYEGTDLIHMAMSSYMYTSGDTDRPPVRISVPQAYLQGGLEAAVGAMVAFHRRQLAGKGQWVDVSVRDSIVRSAHITRPWWDINRQILRRAGPFRTGLSASFGQQEIWPCKEGAVNYYTTGGVGGARTNRALVQWMDEEGMADDFLKTMDWDKFDMATVSKEVYAGLERRVGEFFLSHTSKELYEGAKKRRIMLYPVADIKDLTENEHIMARGFWAKVEHPELGATITYPGASVRCSETPLKILRRAPLIGEHNEEVYQKIGLSKNELLMLKQSSVI